MSAARLYVGGIAALGAGFALFMGALLIGLNYYAEGEGTWWGPPAQIIAMLLILAGIALLLAGAVRSLSRQRVEQ